MAEPANDGFKVFERPQNKQLVHRAVADMVLKGIKEEEKTYGPVFTARFVHNALSYLTPRIGEKPHEGIKDISQLMEYIASKEDRYPSPECVVVYAQVKTENDFQGQTGAGTTIEQISMARQVLESHKVTERNVDVDKAFAVFSQILLAMKIHPDEWGYKRNADGSAEIMVRNCYFQDSCNQCLDEHLLKRPDGRQRCGTVGFICKSLKPVTGYEWDYEVVDAPRPLCTVKCYMI
jgi:hypothetical protein